MIAGCATLALGLASQTHKGEPEPLVPPPPPAAAPARPSPPTKPARAETPQQEPPPKTTAHSDRPIPPPVIADPAASETSADGTTTTASADPPPEERSEPRKARHREASADDPVRHGYALSGSLGYAGCANAWCEGYNRGLGVGAEFGLRWGNVMPLVAYNGGTGPYSTEQLSREVQAQITNSPKIRIHTVGAGVAVFPIGRGHRRVDSFFGVRVGFASVGMDYDMGPVSASERVRRGAVTLSGGAGGFVTQHLTFGIRMDGHVMFKGSNCTTYDAEGFPSVRECDRSDNRESRTDPRDWPFPFNIGLELRYTWSFPPARG